LSKAEEMAGLSVQDHRELRAGTLRTLIRHFGMTVAQFNSFL